jgi:transposase
MEHVAIDLGGRESQICIRAADGGILVEKRVKTAELGRHLAERSSSRVVMETCSEAFVIADAARRLGHEVRVVPATLVRSLGVGARRTKSDRRDAQVLSEVSCRIDLPSVHVPSQAARDAKTMLGRRDAMVATRTKLINTVRGWLRATARRPRGGSSSSFARRVRAMLMALPAYVEAQLRVIEAISDEIKRSNDELKKLCVLDPLCVRLMTVPGVGVVTALRFVATVDDISRFESAHKLESYLGLVPGEHSSSERQCRLGITKAGSTTMRWTLTQAAWSIIRSAKDTALKRWATAIEQRRGKRIAVVAVARKIAGILFAIWRDQSVYDPQRS